MAKKRIQVREHFRLDRFMPPRHPVLVECKKCGKCAQLLGFVFPTNPKALVWRLGDCSCLHCGHQWMAPAGFHFFTKGPLWLRIPCHKNMLWILNREHLDFMEQYISAELREQRIPAMSSRSISSSLPRWLISAKNRDNVVRCLKKLREKLEATRLS